MPSFDIYVLFQFVNRSFRIISTVSLNVTSTLDSIIFFSYLPTIERYIIELFFKRAAAIFSLSVSLLVSV